MVRILLRSVLCTVVAFLVSPLSVAQELGPTPAAAWQRLKEGNARFAEDRPAVKNVGSKRRAELVHEQRPFAVVLACADSRVVPEVLFDQGLGDLFVVRVAGNIAEPGMLGSIVFAVRYLKVPLVVVLGHEGCGAVQAAVEGKKFPGQVGWLVKQIFTGNDLPAEKPAAVAAGIRANALHQAAALLQQSTELKELAAGKQMQVVSGVYSLRTGKVAWLEPPESKGP